MRKLLRKPGIVIGILCLAATALLCLTLRAGHIGKKLGETTGSTVGTAVGSYRGITEGYDAGKEEALQADDTTVRLQGTLKSTGKLEVLVAGVSLTNLHEVGDIYKTLEILKGDIVFTVDLAAAEIDNTDDHTASVKIDPPEAVFYLNEEDSGKIAEAQGFSLTQKAEDGVTAFLNSRAKLTDQIEENVPGYGELYEAAENAAIEQTKNLAEAVCGGKKKVEVGFK